ncbi:glycerate kinase [Halobacillus shinanisalinarum]|uniref:Glycerate kinase n=1 Tax=Halobacillus shinanisalinarum TaxID=2932258 RepID=A0ABY4GX11_9BACI|nr:glycerate kinase [Halobacillus shinanisalinarum]UOQ92460.1 glycerate kinase [Halobacillus shinanisalinarum]
MKIVLAPDSFKGSLTSAQASEAMAKAIYSVDFSIETIIKPMADGGEGTLESLLKATKGKRVSFTCRGPLGDDSESSFVEIENDGVVIEGANISGLPMVPREKRNPDLTTTYGIGEAILYALDKGNKEFVIGLGGSSTNDGGFGMLQALGMKAFDANGKPVGSFGKDIFQVDALDLTSVDPRLQDVTIKVACDVDNPLTGERGASHVYGPQKGATPDQIAAYDEALGKYGRLIEQACGRQFADEEGAGAAGGLGFAFLAIGAELHSGAKLVSDAIGLADAIQQADLVITGEGQSDVQTLYGKAPGYVAKLAETFDKPVILLSGSLDGDLREMNEMFSGCFSIVPGPKTLAECMAEGEVYLYEACRQLTHLLIRLKKE